MTGSNRIEALERRNLFSAAIEVENDETHWVGHDRRAAAVWIDIDRTAASAEGTSPPVQVDLLGLHVDTSEIVLRLSAHTGDGLILGNVLTGLARR